MREIKFRAWDIKNKQFWKQFKISSTSGSIYFPDDLKRNDWILMQFTGLYDINRKEIYEGDIVKLEDVICPITWDDGGFQMITNINQGKSAAIQNRLKYFEIIGNIYETPELLNK